VLQEEEVHFLKEIPLATIVSLLIRVITSPLATLNNIKISHRHREPLMLGMRTS
jgi:hypothetical protein